jgi:hypothetical protein
VSDLHWHQDHLYASTSIVNPNGIAVFDADDLYTDQPTLLLGWQSIVRTAFEGDHLFAVRVNFSSNIRDVAILDISDPESATELGSFSFPELIDPENYRGGIDVDQDMVFVTGGGFGLSIWDASDPTEPFLAGAFLNEHPINDVAARPRFDEGHIMLLSNGAGGQLMLGGREYSSLDVYGSFPIDHLGGEMTRVLWHGDLCFAVIDRVGVVVIDVSLPSAMKQVGLIPAVAWKVDDILIQDDVLYVIEPGLVRLFDLSPEGDPGCQNPADINGDGVLNFYDVSAFLIAYSNGDLVADLDGSGELNFLDVSAFLHSYNAGCP